MNVQINCAQNLVTVDCGPCDPCDQEPRNALVEPQPKKERPRPNAATIAEWGDLYLEAWSFTQIQRRFDNRWSLQTIITHVFRHLYFRELKNTQSLEERLKVSMLNNKGIVAINTRLNEEVKLLYKRNDELKDEVFFYANR